MATQAKLIAFHGDKEIKRKYVRRVTAHEKADQIVKGQYWVQGKGCAVGCTLHNPIGDHARYESELGIPQIIARLEDLLFEGMPNDEAKTWPRRFLKSIRVGADLSLVWPRFVVWMLVDEQAGVIRFDKKEETRSPIRRVADLYSDVIEGKDISREKWVDAASAAADAARCAGYAAKYAGYAAKYAAAAAAADAARCADAAAAAGAYGIKHYSLMAGKLIELLGESPVAANE